MLALGAHVEGVVDAPAAGSPRLLGDEDRRHELLEHASAPARHDVHAAVGVGALVDVDAQVGAGDADRLHLGPGPVTAGREGAPGGEVVLAGDLAGEDAEVARDPGLRHDRVVVVGGEPDVLAADVGALVGPAGAAVGERVEATVHEATGAHRGVPVLAVAGVVERVPAHLVEQRPRPAPGLLVGVGDDEQGGAEPAAVDAGDEGLDRVTAGGPGAQGLAGGLVVPVEEHPARLVVLHALQGRDGRKQPPAAVGLGDDAELARDDRRPEVAADVRRRGVARPVARGERLGDVVGRQPGRGSVMASRLCQVSAAHWWRTRVRLARRSRGGRGGRGGRPGPGAGDGGRLRCQAEGGQGGGAAHEELAAVGGAGG